MSPAKTWQRLLLDEEGTALTNHFPFYLSVAALAGGAWYLWGDRLHGLMQMVATSMPPAGPGTGFR